MFLKRERRKRKIWHMKLFYSPRNDKKVKLKVSTPNLYRGKAYLDLTPCNVRCRTPGYEEKILKQKVKWGWNQISIMKTVKNSDFGIFPAIWRLLGSTGPAHFSVQWEFRQSGSPILLAKPPFLAAHLPVSQDSSSRFDRVLTWMSQNSSWRGKTLWHKTTSPEREP